MHGHAGRDRLIRIQRWFPTASAVGPMQFSNNPFNLLLAHLTKAQNPFSNVTGSVFGGTVHEPVRHAEHSIPSGARRPTGSPPLVKRAPRVGFVDRSDVRTLYRARRCACVQHAFSLQRRSCDRAGQPADQRTALQNGETLGSTSSMRYRAFGRNQSCKHGRDHRADVEQSWYHYRAFAAGNLPLTARVGADAEVRCDRRSCVSESAKKSAGKKSGVKVLFALLAIGLFVAVASRSRSDTRRQDRPIAGRQGCPW